MTDDTEVDEPLGEEPPEKPMRAALRIEARNMEDRHRAASEVLTRPTIHGAQTLMNWVRLLRDVDVNELADELARKAAAIGAGDLSLAETMLITQAQTLDALFNTLASRSVGEMPVSLFDTYMRLALKAQGQCRTTLEALAEIKNPRQVAFVRQANIAAGPQQVNNGPSGAGDSEKPPNKLLEQPHEQWLDVRAQSTAGTADPALATLGAFNRTTHDGR